MTIDDVSAKELEADIGTADLPSLGYVSSLLQTLQNDIEAAQPIRSAHRGAPASLSEAIATTVESLSDKLVGLSHYIHANPELGFEELLAVSAIAKLLAGEGHEVEVGAYGLSTALRAEAGTGRPRVAVLAEYDALPDIGHACGHNVIAATAVGAFLAIAQVTEHLQGSIMLLGTPAEEGGGGKELLARAGAFDEVDAVVMLHPAGLDIAEHSWIGVRSIDVAYHGVPAHASATPFLGRNALDAAVTAYQSMAQLRQHMLPSDRIHGIITDGGQKPNIVPASAALSFMLRSAAPETLEGLSSRAEEIFRAAAIATGTRLELRWDPMPVYLPVRSNAALAARWATNVARRGRRALPRGVVPDLISGSTDLGNVSVRVPSIHPTLAIAPSHVATHTPEFALHSRSPAADAGVIDGAIGLALTAADFLTDSKLRRDVSAEFEAAGGAMDLSVPT